MKKCSKCKLILTDESFVKCKDRKSGLSSHCKACKKVWSKLNYKLNSAILNEKSKLHRKTPRGKFLFAKAQANRRKLSFTLTEQEYAYFISNTRCHYCNDYINEPYGVGLDRIDSLEGYTATNVVRCCWTCNTMKSALSYSEFINHIEKIYLNLIDKGSEESYNIKTHPIKEDKCQKNKKKTQ